MGEERREEGRIEELDETVMYSLYVLSAIPFVFGTFFYVLRTLFILFYFLLFSSLKWANVFFKTCIYYLLFLLQ